jgi:integral membrane protein (TIGR01906 family)
MHKKIFYSLIAVCALAVFVIIFVSSLFSYLYNVNYYDRKYQQYDVYERFTREEALNATHNLFGYFRGREELDTDFFNEDEISHLYDVKELIWQTQVVYMISLFVFWGIIGGVYIFSRRVFMSFFPVMLFFAGIFSVSLLLLLGLFYLVFGFDFLFLKFHEILFVDNYAFNPAVSNMKALFPNEFFLDIGRSIIFSVFLKSALLVAAGYFLARRLRYTKPKRR